MEENRKKRREMKGGRERICRGERERIKTDRF
jgi:hypothetical protein